MVVFAPHDLIRDAPFNKLDIITCRNLLIYLEPELQKKIRGPPKPFNVYYGEEHIGTFDYVPFAIDFLQKNKNITINGHYIRKVLYGERNKTHGYVFRYVS
jgi:hypothetical protein